MAADSSESESNKEDFDADFKENFNQDMLAMLNKGSSNDVRIILGDGEITANKDVLAARCEYFAANFRWKEETKDDSDIIEITDCSKEVMQRIIQYLFTGSIKFKDLTLLQLLELVNQVRKLLLDGDLQVMIESYIRDKVLSVETLKKICPVSFQSHSKYTLCVNIIHGLQYVKNYGIEDVESCIIRGIIVLLPYICQNKAANSAFSTLSLQAVKDLFSCIHRLLDWKKPKTRVLNTARFRCLLSWYEQNKNWSQEDKEEILGTFNLDLFSATELFQLVKPSGLFPEDEVDKRIPKALGESDKKAILEEINQAAN